MKGIYSFLQPVDFIIVVAYLLILLGIGYWVSFIRKKKEGENLFLAERSLGWASIGLNMWGTNVGPSMLIASASIGYTTGIVAGNFAWYAFVFILLLALVFAPRYLGELRYYRRSGFFRSDDWHDRRNPDIRCAFRSCCCQSAVALNYPTALRLPLVPRVPEVHRLRA